MTQRPFHQVDVFSNVPLMGNPVAVVHDAAGLTDAQMAAFANWTNLSETTFLFPPEHPDADYKVRIFTPGAEIPFAGHPTLGTCHAWLAAGGVPRAEGVIVQECNIGPVRIRRDVDLLAFAAPPLIQSGPIDADTLTDITGFLGISGAEIRAHQWVVNGPQWCAVMLDSAEKVLALKPDFARKSDLMLGVVGPYPPGSNAAFEVRGFALGVGVGEDPVTGSLNAGIARWLIGAGLAPSQYVVAQGAAVGRAGHVYVEKVGADIWVGGHVTPCIEGVVSI